MFVSASRTRRLLRAMYWKHFITLCGGYVGTGFRVDRGLSFKCSPHSGIYIGNNVSIGRDVVVDVPHGGCLKIHDGVKLNMAVVLGVRSRVVIGKDTLIGEYSSVRDSDHGIEMNGVRIQDQDMVSDPVAIGEDVWIGRGVAILKGVTLERGCVVAANCVVRNSFESNSVIAGVPGRKVRTRGAFPGCQ